MKIAIATGPWFPVPTVQGGAHHRLWQGLAEEFAAVGHDVTIVCRSYPTQPRTETIKGVRYFRWGGFSQSTNIWFDLIKDGLYALTTFPVLPQSDILVINDFWLPVIAPFHPRVDRAVLSVGRFPKGQFRLYQGVDRFAVVSQAIKTELAQQNPAAIARTRLIPNAIDIHTFSPRRSPKAIQTEKVILYVGRLHPEKGVHVLLDAFAVLSKQLPHAKLRIIGPVKSEQGGGGSDYFKLLQQKASGLNVEFQAPIFDPDLLAEAYRNADLFCYPSLAEKGEAFGVAPLEAMACGVVPIVSSLDCFKDFIEDQQTGYFFDHRSQTAEINLATTLQSALTNEIRTNVIAENAAKKACQYSYLQVAKQYLSDFESLLETPLEAETQC